ncbi:hypothetical protein N7453_006691 [Penicillium expansum]|nr:hypothetical protein N7453_006691 [Penicillium expansum]
MTQVEMLRLFILKTSWEMDCIGRASRRKPSTRRGLKLSANSPIRWLCVTSGQIDYTAKLPTERFRFTGVIDTLVTTLLNVSDHGRRRGDPDAEDWGVYF